MVLCTPYCTVTVPYPASLDVVGAGPGSKEGDVSWTHWPPPRHDRIHDVTTSSAASPIFKRLARASFGLMVSPCSLFLFSYYSGTLLVNYFITLPIYPSSRTRNPFLALGSCALLSVSPPYIVQYCHCEPRKRSLVSYYRPALPSVNTLRFCQPASTA